MLLSLTTGEWLVAAGSAAVLLLSVAPLVWLCWRFVQMSDAEVARTIEGVDRFIDLRDQARRAMWVSQDEALPRPVVATGRKEPGMESHVREAV